MRTRRDVLRENKNGIVHDGGSTRQSSTRQGSPREGSAREGSTRWSFISVSLAATGGLLVAVQSTGFGAQMQMPAAAGPSPFPSHYIQIDPDDRGHGHPPSSFVMSFLYATADTRAIRKSARER